MRIPLIERTLVTMTIARRIASLGRRPFEEHTPMAQQPPAWMAALVDVVADCLEAHSPMGPLGFRYLEEEALGELVVYPTPVELVGGAADGTVVVPGFSLDLQALLTAFERVTDLQWCAHGFGPCDPEGPCVSLEGIYQGHPVWLRVLAEPPEDEPPGLQLDTAACAPQ